MIMQPPEVALDELIEVNFYSDKVYPYNTTIKVNNKPIDKTIDQILISVRKLNKSVEVEEIPTEPTDVS